MAFFTILLAVTLPTSLSPLSRGLTRVPCTSVCNTGEVGVISNPNSRGYCETKHPVSGSSSGDNVCLPRIWMFRCECPRALDVMPSVGNTALNETDLDPALLKLRE